MCNNIILSFLQVIQRRQGKIETIIHIIQADNASIFIHQLNRHILQIDGPKIFAHGCIGRQQVFILQGKCRQIPHGQLCQNIIVQNRRIQCGIKILRHVVVVVIQDEIQVFGTTDINHSLGHIIQIIHIQAAAKSEHPSQFQGEGNISIFHAISIRHEIQFNGGHRACRDFPHQGLTASYQGIHGRAIGQIHIESHQGKRRARRLEFGIDGGNHTIGIIIAVGNGDDGSTGGSRGGGDGNREKGVSILLGNGIITEGHLDGDEVHFHDIVKLCGQGELKMRGGGAEIIVAESRIDD